jgi:hypothetical protein
MVTCYKISKNGDVIWIVSLKEWGNWKNYLRDFEKKQEINETTKMHQGNEIIDRAWSRWT